MDLTLENLDIGKEKVKDVVIKILSHEWPLTIKKIYYKIKKEYNLGVSYQAVHKVVNQLVEKKVLEKSKKEYHISLEWVENLGSLAKNLKESYSKNKPLILHGLVDFEEKEDYVTLDFETLGDAENYRKKLQAEYMLKPHPKPPYCGETAHLKSPLVYSEKSINVLNLVESSKTDCYIIVRGDSEVDKYCARYYRNSLVRVRTGVDYKANCEVMVIGEVIFQEYIPESTLSMLDELYKKTQDISEINISRFFNEIYNRKEVVKVIVYKNKEIANELRNSIISKFKANNEIAFFDIDGVLVKGFSLLDFVKFLEKRKIIKPEFFKKMLTLLADYKDKKIGYQKFAYDAVKIYSSSIKGKKQSEIENLAKEFIKSGEFSLIPYSKKVFDLINDYRKTVAITGSPIELVKAMRDIFNFDEIYASELILKNNIYSGKVKLNLALAGEKERLITQYFKKNSFKNSVGFGDSESDIPFLEKVNYPVIINSDDKLKAIAESKGWLIINEAELEKDLKKISNVV